jgi:hypothetical protein
VAAIRDAIGNLAQRIAEVKAKNTQEAVEGAREEDTYSDIGEEFLNDEEVEGRDRSTSPEFDEQGISDILDLRSRDTIENRLPLLLSTTIPILSSTIPSSTMSFEISKTGWKQWIRNSRGSLRSR